MNYDVDYFLKKFSAIPDERWCEGSRHYHGKSCALGFTHPADCWRSTPETLALAAIVAPHGAGFQREIAVASINNGTNPQYQQPTPKARILAALHDIKSKAEQAMEAYETRELKPMNSQPVEAI